MITNGAVNIKTLIIFQRTDQPITAVCLRRRHTRLLLYQLPSMNSKRSAIEKFYLVYLFTINVLSELFTVDEILKPH